MPAGCANRALSQRLATGSRQRRDSCRVTGEMRGHGVPSRFGRIRIGCPPRLKRELMQVHTCWRSYLLVNGPANQCVSELSTLIAVCAQQPGREQALEGVDELVTVDSGDFSGNRRVKARTEYAARMNLRSISPT